MPEIDLDLLDDESLEGTLLEMVREMNALKRRVAKLEREQEEFEDIDLDSDEEL